MKVYFETYGCSLNFADTETMKGLAAMKHKIVDDEKKADVVIINSCTVKGPTETKILKRMKQLKEKGKKVILAGCMPQADPNKYKDIFVIGTSQLTKITEALDKIEHKEKVEQYLKTENEIRLNLPKIRHNPLIAIIPVSKGCLNTCYYCKTKFARGHLASFPEEEIMKEAQTAIKEGAKEIWITSQDNGCYGFDIKKTMPELLNRLCELEGDFMIRVGMANPQYVKQYLKEWITAFKHPKVFKFLHIPVQAGSDKVLKAMNRQHTVNDFTAIISAFRKEFTDITISTDIICGYPGETKEQWEKTITLVKETRPDIINISKFWPRPGTRAAAMKQLRGSEIKKRSTQLHKLFNKISKDNNKKWLGWKGKVIITEKGKDNTWIGHNFAYKQVIVKGELLMGKTLEVTIKDTTIYDLRA